MAMTTEVDVIVWAVRVMTLLTCYCMLTFGIGYAANAFSLDPLSVMIITAVVCGSVSTFPLSGLYANDREGDGER
jgi:hypothetical protein